MQNWFGLEGHPTDSYIHWKTRGKDRLKEAAALREAYDKIIALNLKKELDLLLEAAYNSGKIDEYETTCEDL